MVNRAVTMIHLNLQAKNSLFISIVSLLNHIVLTFIGAILLVQSDMQFGILVAFNNYSRTLSSSLDSLVQVKANLQGALASIERLNTVNEMFDAYLSEEEEKAKLKDKIQEISFNGICSSIGGKIVLEKFDYTFKNGITGIKGENGGGKTRIMNLIVKNHICDKGEIYINGLPIHSIKYNSLISKIAYVGTDKILYNLSLRENITLFETLEHVSDTEINDILNAVQLLSDIVELPDGLDT